MIKLIVATDLNGVIGDSKKPGLLWRSKADLKHFRRTTLNHWVLMGRTTYETIGRPLEKRFNLICTNNTFKVDNQYSNIWSGTLKQCIGKYEIECKKFIHSHAKYLDGKDLYIIGGKQIYDQFLDSRDLDELIVTRLNLEVEGDLKFVVPKGWKWYMSKPLYEHSDFEGVVLYYRKSK